MYKNLKIFDAYPVKKHDVLDPHKLKWGNSNMYDATVIQNICWLNGLAPRVYDITKIRFFNQFFYAQVIDVVEGKQTDYEGANALYDNIKELGKEWGFESISDKVSRFDFIDGKLIDFNTLKLSENFNDVMRDKYIKLGQYGSIYYHNVKELNLVNAPRKNEQRVKWMKLDEIEFENKSVADLGSAGGFFCRYAKDRLANSVIGYDMENEGSLDPITASFLLANMLQYWDIDFISLDLKKHKPKKADIVLFLSMNYHIGIPDWLPEVTGEVCVFEDNSKQRNAKEKLAKMFKQVELVGHSKDHGDKPVYHCHK